MVSLIKQEDTELVSLEEIKDRCKEIADSIERLFIETGYKEYGQICIVGSGETIESHSLYENLVEYMQRLDMASIYIDQACAKDVEQGVVIREEDGSYWFKGRELIAGDIIQVFDEESQYWRVAMLEDCFIPSKPRLIIQGEPEIDLDGVEIRHVVTDYS